MINVSATYNTIISNGGHYEWQIINNATTIGKDKILSGSIESAAFDKLTVGKTCSAQLNLTLRDVTLDSNYPLEVQFRAVNDTQQSSWEDRGYFYIDTIKKSPYSSITEVTAFDGMMLLDGLTYDSWTSVTTATVVNWAEIWTYTSLGLTIYDLITNSPVALTNIPNLGKGGTSLRELLGYVGTIYGGNFVISPSASGGILELIQPYNAPANTANIGDAVQTFDAGSTMTVKRVRLWLDNKTYYLEPTGYTEAQWLALGGYCIDVSLPFYATQSIAHSIYTNFVNKTFVPFTANGAYVDPKYEVGDGITFHTASPITSIIASHTLNMNALSPSDIQFAGEDIINDQHPYQDPTDKDMQYDIARIKDALNISGNDMSFPGDLSIAGDLNVTGSIDFGATASETAAVTVATASTSGITISSQTWRRFGKVCVGTIAFYGTINAGGNADFSIISAWRSPQEVFGVGYYSQTPLVARMYANSATLRVRNASGTARTATSSDPFMISVTYIQ